MTVLVPYTRGELVQLAHERTQVISERHTSDGTQLVIRVPAELVDRFAGFTLASQDELLPPE